MPGGLENLLLASSASAEASSLTQQLRGWQCLACMAAYIKQHSMEQVLENIVNDVLDEQPANPFQMMVRGQIIHLSKNISSPMS